MAHVQCTTITMTHGVVLGLVSYYHYDSWCTGLILITPFLITAPWFNCVLILRCCFCASYFRRSSFDGDGRQNCGVAGTNGKRDGDGKKRRRTLRVKKLCIRNTPRRHQAPFPFHPSQRCRVQMRTVLVWAGEWWWVSQITRIMLFVSNITIKNERGGGYGGGTAVPCIVRHRRHS